MFSLRSSYASSQGEAIRRPSRRPTTPKASCCRDLSAGSPTSGRSRNRRAVALNPNLDDAHHRLGNIYFHIGLLDKAIEELRKTLAISPRDDKPPQMAPSTIKRARWMVPIRSTPVWYVSRGWR